jgi:LysM repeat protein
MFATAVLALALAGGRSVTVQPGDTLSGIAAGTGDTWQQLCADNHIADCNLIYVGQVITVPGSGYTATVAGYGSTGGGSYYTPQPAPPPAPAPAPASYVPSGGGFQSCVIQRESGGNPGAVNPSSGAGGLYQFLPSTWSSLGYSGSPQDAPVSVQNQAFARLYAQDGTSPWGPSDGC